MGTAQNGAQENEIFGRFPAVNPQKDGRKPMKAGALRSFEQTIWHHLDGLREAAWRREPDRQVWLYLYAPDPNHPWHRAHAKACGWVEGSTIFDQGVAAYTIAGDIAHDLNGKPVYQIVGNWFFAFGTNEPKMWADSDYETGGP
jgi:hypothetical protein